MDLSKSTPIPDAVKEAFDALRDPGYNNFCLMAVVANGKPATAICAIELVPHGQHVSITPLFITIPDNMELLGPDGRPFTTQIDGEAHD